eukprot:TRINITY_DN18142_c0_g1_i1.p1 TRINITY_DN18142_c0_g1~~TRINITY_DN18142_c0_g1_i1.p1  ORF type:complete len:762 (+),score=198.30 TRINITY_DN18142_c0_g1_i1:94-2379(+)
MAAGGDGLSALDLYEQAGECGLQNPIGQNNCFLNSVLQIMYHMQDFREALINAAVAKLPASVFDDVEDVDAMEKLTPPQRALLRIHRLFKVYHSRKDRVLNPQELRAAMAELFPMFKAGSLQDAHECLEAVLDVVHKALVPAVPADADSDGGAEDDDELPSSVAYSFFGIHLELSAVCPAANCEQRTSRRHRNDSFYRTIWAHTLLKDTIDGGDSGVFERLLRGDDQPITCDHCKAKIEIVTSLRAAPPKVFAINVSWFTESVDRKALRKFLASVPAVWNVKDTLPLAKGVAEREAADAFSGQLTQSTPLIGGSEPPVSYLSQGSDIRSESSISAFSDGAAPPRTRPVACDEQIAVLEGVVFYYGLHYVSSFYNREIKQWVVFDDSRVRGVKGSVLSLWKHAADGKLMPFMLFYRTGKRTDPDIAETLAQFDSERQGDEPNALGVASSGAASECSAEVLKWLQDNTRPDLDEMPKRGRVSLFASNSSTNLAPRGPAIDVDTPADAVIHEALRTAENDDPFAFYVDDVEEKVPVKKPATKQAKKKPAAKKPAAKKPATKKPVEQKDTPAQDSDSDSDSKPSWITRKRRTAPVQKKPEKKRRLDRSVRDSETTPHTDGGTTPHTDAGADAETAGEDPTGGPDHTGARYKSGRLDKWSTADTVASGDVLPAAVLEKPATMRVRGRFKVPQASATKTLVVAAADTGADVCDQRKQALKRCDEATQQLAKMHQRYYVESVRDPAEMLEYATTWMNLSIEAKAVRDS